VQFVAERDASSPVSIPQPEMQFLYEHHRKIFCRHSGCTALPHGVSRGLVASINTLARKAFRRRSN
jgi:3-dehydroquinate dehydratase